VAVATEPLAVDRTTREGTRRPGLAIFDLDRTLLRGSSLVALARELSVRGLLSRRALLGALARDARYRRLGASDHTVATVRALVARLAAGRDYEPLCQVAETVGDGLARQMSPAARMLVRRHQSVGDFCVVLSASPQELVDAVVRGLDLHRGVGTKAEVVDGRLTGRLVGPFCYGAGKLERLRAELGEVDFDDAWAYADSQSDLPLLCRVRHPVAINPDRALERFAGRHRWPVLRI
jgi:HAD superfamily hydrolase (TIGR01490 family)